MNGVVVWFTGLPSSGKTTLAKQFRAALSQRAIPCCLLDGDEVRGALVPSPGYGDAERSAFYATLANLAALLAGQNLIVLVPATANRRTYRETARAAAPRFIEVYVDTPLEECRQRDDKGLYAKASSGDVASLPGSGGDYEPPEAADVVAHGGKDPNAISALLSLVSAAKDTGV